MRLVGFPSFPPLAINIGDTTPVPPAGTGTVIYSPLAQTLLLFNGTFWEGLVTTTQSFTAAPTPSPTPAPTGNTPAPTPPGALLTQGEGVLLTHAGFVLVAEPSGVPGSLPPTAAPTPSPTHNFTLAPTPVATPAPTITPVTTLSPTPGSTLYFPPTTTAPTPPPPTVAPTPAPTPASYIYVGENGGSGTITRSFGSTTGGFIYTTNSDYGSQAGAKILTLHDQNGTAIPFTPILQYGSGISFQAYALAWVPQWGTGVTSITYTTTGGSTTAGTAYELASLTTNSIITAGNSALAVQTGVSNSSNAITCALTPTLQASTGVLFSLAIGLTRTESPTTGSGFTSILSSGNVRAEAKGLQIANNGVATAATFTNGGNSGDAFLTFAVAIDSAYSYTYGPSASPTPAPTAGPTPAPTTAAPTPAPVTLAPTPSPTVPSIYVGMTSSGGSSKTVTRSIGNNNGGFVFMNGGDGAITVTALTDQASNAIPYTVLETYVSGVSFQSYCLLWVPNFGTGVTAVTLTCSESSNSGVAIFEFAGLTNSLAVNAANFGATSATTTNTANGITSPVFTPVYANTTALLFAFSADMTRNSAPSVGTNLTGITSTINSTAFRFAYRVLTAATTPTVAATFTGVSNSGDTYLTIAAVIDIGNSGTLSPTPSPTPGPTPSPTSASPTPAPTPGPTPSPTTAGPTPSPTTSGPTPSPTPSPTTTGNAVLTESGDTRITESGDPRITET